MKFREHTLEEVVAFLCGEAQLEGHWFGDEGPRDKNGHRRNFWWRPILRKAALKAAAEGKKA